jgi:uncharacterized damage-inducible protein DinB
MPSRELETFLSTWEHQASNVMRALRALPAGKYDFRPDPEARSLGELGWHLAELEGYMTFSIERGGMTLREKPPGIERPREIAALAPGYERVHADAVARVRRLAVEDFDRKIPFFDGRPMEIRRMLWDAMLHHSIHHLGQLTVVMRLAGGMAPGLYGPNREESAAMRAASAAKTAG